MNIVFHDTDQWYHPDISRTTEADLERASELARSLGLATREARERELATLMEGAE